MSDLEETAEKFTTPSLKPIMTAADKEYFDNIFKDVRTIELNFDSIPGISDGFTRGL